VDGQQNDGNDEFIESDSVSDKKMHNILQKCGLKSFILKFEISFLLLFQGLKNFVNLAYHLQISK